LPRTAPTAAADASAQSWQRLKMLVGNNRKQSSTAVLACSPQPQLAWHQQLAAMMLAEACIADNVWTVRICWQAATACH
jgi:hypothetical protein